MGLSDFFANYKAERAKKALLKNIRRLIHQDLQHEDRLRAAEFLSEVGTTEALYGLLRRYDMSLDKGYMDQDEKTYVHDILVSKGPSAVEPIKQFLAKSENVTWPERILRSILKDDGKVVELLLEVVEKEKVDGSDLRAAKRANLLSLLNGYEDERIAPAVIEFLEDYDESVRMVTLEVLDAQGDATALEPSLKLFLSDEEDSMRVKRRVLDLLANHQWAVPAELRSAVQAGLPQDFKMSAGGELTHLH